MTHHFSEVVPYLYLRQERLAFIIYRPGHSIERNTTSIGACIHSKARSRLETKRSHSLWDRSDHADRARPAFCRGTETFRWTCHHHNSTGDGHYDANCVQLWTYGGTLSLGRLSLYLRGTRPQSSSWFFSRPPKMPVKKHTKTVAINILRFGFSTSSERVLTPSNPP